MSCKKSFKHAVPAKCGRRRGHRDDSSSASCAARRRRRHHHKPSNSCRPKPKHCR